MGKYRMVLKVDVETEVDLTPAQVVEAFEALASDIGDLGSSFYIENPDYDENEAVEADEAGENYDEEPEIEVDVCGYAAQVLHDETVQASIWLLEDGAWAEYR
jgi:hypothetical protein